MTFFSLKSNNFVVKSNKTIYNIICGDKMENKEVVKKINEVLDKIRPYLENDGGNVTFKKYENGVVYVSLVGACSNCPMASLTLREGIENALINEIPEVIKVVNED